MVQEEELSVRLESLLEAFAEFLPRSSQSLLGEPLYLSLSPDRR